MLLNAMQSPLRLQYSARILFVQLDDVKIVIYDIYSYNICIHIGNSN